MFRSVEVIRVLYSFPLRIGAGGICMAAWHHVNALAQAGAHVLVQTGSVKRELPATIAVTPTLAWGMARVPYRALGLRRAMALHDHIVARRLPGLIEDVDIVHTWPGGAEETLTTARQLSLPSVLERPNAHTRHAYEIVRREADRLGVTLPPGHDHAYNERVLHREEHEFELADRLLCPSEFVANTFIEEGFGPERLAPHTYGYDESVFYPDRTARDPSRPLQALFVGADALRKGLHYALEAWLRSPARESGTFRVLGELTPGYGEKLAPMLADPSVEFLGLRTDYPELLRNSDILLLPTLEEGAPMVCVDALASGCVPVVSDVCAGVCQHLENALVHPVGDVDLLTEHLTMLHDDADLLERLREGALRSAPQYTWQASGARLLDVYRGLLAPEADPVDDGAEDAELQRGEVGADGRRPRDRFLVFGKPVIGDAEIAEVVDSLRSAWIGTGPKVARFERMLEGYIGVQNVRCVGSCTAALSLAIRVLGIGPGDEVIVPAMTFIASANAVEHAGATIVLVDCEPDTGSMDLDAVEAAITPRTAAILPVHMAGRPIDMDRLNAIRDRHQVLVIEDAAHAIGAEWRGTRIGDHGNLTAYSFYATKNITTAEGGALATDDEELANRVERLALHGLSVGAWQRFSDTGFKHYEVVEPGFKFNMTDLQAAIGIHQLPQLDAWIESRATIWHRYETLLAGVPLTLPAEIGPEMKHARHLFQVLVEPDATLGRDDLLSHLSRQNIGAGVHYRGVHLHPYYRDKYRLDPASLPVATDISERTLSLPLAPNLTDQDLEDVVAALRSGLTRGR